MGSRAARVCWLLPSGVWWFLSVFILGCVCEFLVWCFVLYFCGVLWVCNGFLWVLIGFVGLLCYAGLLCCCSSACFSFTVVGVGHLYQM